MTETQASGAFMGFITQIVVAQSSAGNLKPQEIPAFIRNLLSAFTTLGKPDAGADEMLTPAVPIKRSVFPDYIVCLEDGKKLKMLKRHLQSSYNMTPDQYRERWGLKSDYPMVAPKYAQHRSALAKKIGLGRLPSQVSPAGRPLATKEFVENVVVDASADESTPAKAAKARSKKAAADASEEGKTARTQRAKTAPEGSDATTE